MAYRLTKEELRNFCDQLYMILHAGISSIEGLRMMEEDSTDEAARKLYEELISYEEEAGVLSYSLKRSEAFPEEMISYISAGEDTGCLDEVLLSLSEKYEQDINIASRIKSAVTYPFIMLIMMAAVVVILLVKVLPVFQQVFQSMGMEMTGVSGGLLSLGSAISRYSAVFWAVLILLLLIGVLLGFTTKGRAIFTSLMQHIPVLKEIPLSISYARLSQGINMGTRSGLDPETSLNMAIQMVDHPLIKEKISKAQELLSQGELFPDAMTESGLYTGMDARLIKIGYRSGSVEESMMKLSRRYSEESAQRTERIISVIEPTIVILMCILVGLILLSVMMPMLGILSALM